MWRLAWVLILGGCLPEYVLCADGRLCAPGMVCNDTYATCVTPDQVDACVGLAEGDACELPGGIAGFCADGVCFQPACGDRIVQAVEECDDGNADAGDGCTAQCVRELCGNRIVDSVVGEQCDDGNLRSHDGCDSACTTEHLAWTLRQCGEPPFAVQRNTTYDDTRRRLVHVDNDYIIEWGGERWECVMYRDPGPDGYNTFIKNVFYDPSRQRVVGVAATEVHEWDGTALTIRPSSPSPNDYLHIVFDTRRNLAATYAIDRNVWYWNPVDATWSMTTPLSGSTPPNQFNFNHVLAFDHANDRLVMLLETVGMTHETWLWDMTTRQWTQTGQTIPVDRHMSATYHAQLQQVVAFGGYTNTTVHGDLYAWNGAQWNLLSTSPEPRSSTALAFDSVSQSLVVAGGTADQLFYDGDVWRWNGTTWTGWSSSGLTPESMIAVDGFPPTGQVIATTSDGETWAWNGVEWGRIDSAAIPVTPRLVMAYHPDWQRLVAYTPAGWFGEFDGQTWNTVATDPTPIDPGVMLYDHDQNRLLMLGLDGNTYVRNTEWDDLGIPAMWAATVAYDRRDHRAIALQPGFDGDFAFEFTPTGWAEIFAFPASEFSMSRYAVGSYLPGGHVLFVDAYGGATWEPLDNLWRRWSERPPDTFEWVVPDPARGELILLTRYGRNVIGYGFTSDLPIEVCADGVDADGDGAANCDDDDCWWRCSPGCPPLSSCEI